MRRRLTDPTETASLPSLDVSLSTRDVHGIAAFEDTPAIVSLSDIHGYYDAAHSALTAVGEVREPVVTEDADERLHWADSNYVLLFNGDLIDRGDENRRVLELALRLKHEAPPGRVRLHLGNHEMAVLLPEILHWPRTYSGKLSREARESFIEQVRDGVWTVAFEGYGHTYSHAGREEPFDVAAVNERLLDCARELHEGLADGTFARVQEDVPDRYETIFGLDRDGRGPEAGLLWMDFLHMPRHAPPQVVGHSRQQQVVRKGDVVCQNTIRSNLRSPGGEAVVVETPDEITAVVREGDGSVSVEPPAAVPS